MSRFNLLPAHWSRQTSVPIFPYNLNHGIWHRASTMYGNTKASVRAVVEGVPYSP